MKILVIHNFHQDGSASGDDAVFRNETKLLEDKGNTVIRYTVSNNEYFRSGIFGKLKALNGVLWSRKHYKNVIKIIKATKPDIVHVHTFFPLLSPSVLKAAKKENVKLVATLHDTRFVCPVCTSLRDNIICNECIDGKYFRMCKYKCFKNSRLKSFALAMIFKIYRKKNVFKKYIDCYICLNDVQRNLLITAGYDTHKLTKKYNFVNDPLVNFQCKPVEMEFPLNYVVYYGRIGEEKGMDQLMEVWSKIDNIPLIVMGSGPLEKKVKEYSDNKKNVYFLGYTPHEKCLNIVKQSKFVIFPSIWYEGCSMVLIESMALGKPVITFDVGFCMEAIKDGYNGYKVPLKNTEAMRNKIIKLWNMPIEQTVMGENARKEYLKKYGPESNYEQLKEIYEKLL